MPDKIIKQNGVIWFDKTGLSVYLENKSFIRLNFTQDVFENLEIIDRPKLGNLIETFIKQGNLNYLSFVLIMTSDVLFEKDWIMPQNEVQKKEESDFIDNIPFENTIVHSWIKDNKVKLIAVNQDVIFFIRDIFEKNGGHMIGAFPYSLFRANVRNESVKEILKSVNDFKQDDLIEISSQLPSKVNISSEQKPNKKNSSLPLLVGIFAILLIILVYLLFKK
ncbi:hypothetical protein CO044_03460 [Candidatus Peregrinibacteria bacterium CG_4_9_14_0_2_um_filter_38_9]|nr:MAG: hypothetical protein CO044_03460 [Candidatus Peregrinibacteria bacterium CG_4_9_14_0_2_um_filter_38_9]